MNRRHFLASGAATLLARRELWSQPAQVMPLGFSLYGMRSLELRAGLEACSKIGYDAVELALMPGYSAEPSRLNAALRRQTRTLLGDLKLSLAALMENLPVSGVEKEQLERIKAAAELGHALAPDAPPILETILGGGVNDWEKLRESFATRVGAWAKVAQEHRIVVCVKPHRLGAMNRPEHATWLLERVGSPWVKAAYDYSHFEHRQMTIAETMKPLVPVSRFVHLKDCRIENGRMQFLLPGDGQVNYADYLRELKGAGYRGCVCVEVSGMVSGQKGYDPIAAARRCYANLAPAFAKADVRRV